METIHIIFLWIVFGAIAAYEAYENNEVGGAIVVFLFGPMGFLAALEITNLEATRKLIGNKIHIFVYFLPVLALLLLWWL